VLLAFDFARAYDTIDHKMLRVKLLNRGVPGCLVSWIYAFFKDRRASACTDVNGVRSGYRAFRAGLPQGSVLAPTLYTLWASDLVKEMRGSGSDVFMYADEPATLSSGPTIEIALQRAQRATDTIEADTSEVGSALEDDAGR
jgi:hypothetical protein